MSVPFEINTLTIHKISGREFDSALSEAAGHWFDPVVESEVPGDDSGGHLTLHISSPISPDNCDLLAFLAFMGGRGLSTRSVATGYLLHLAIQGLVPYGEYHIEYSWG